MVTTGTSVKKWVVLPARCIQLAPVLRKIRGNSIHRRNHFPADSVARFLIRWIAINPVDSAFQTSNNRGQVVIFVVRAKECDTKSWQGDDCSKPSSYWCKCTVYPVMSFYFRLFHVIVSSFFKIQLDYKQSPFPSLFRLVSEKKSAQCENLGRTWARRCQVFARRWLYLLVTFFACSAD